MNIAERMKEEEESLKDFDFEECYYEDLELYEGSYGAYRFIDGSIFHFDSSGSYTFSNFEEFKPFYEEVLKCLEEEKQERE